MRILLLFLIGIVTSIVNAAGCSRCLNQDKDKLRLGCFSKCREAFSPSTSEWRACREQCTGFVLEDNCCNSPCSAKPNTCLNDYFHRVGLSKREYSDREEFRTWLESIQKNPDRLDKRALLAGDAPYHFIRSTEDLRLLKHPDFHDTIVHDVSEHGEHNLERRVDRGKVCCLAAKTVLNTGALQVAPALQKDDWNEEEYAGLVLVSFGVAGAWACHHIFNVQCVFFNGQPAPEQ